MKSSIALFSLLGLVSAYAIPEFELSHRPTLKRDSWDDCDYDDCETDSTLNATDYCGHHPTEWDDRNIAANVWWETGAGIFLDWWIRTKYQQTGKQPDNWLQILNEEYNPSDETDNTVWSCATMEEGSCTISASCEDYLEAKAEQLYYINFAAMNVHTAYATLHENLQDWAISTGFDIKSTVEEFVGPVSGFNPYGLTSASFGIASGVMSATGPISAALGIISGSFGVAAQFKSSHDNTETSLEDAIGDYFDDTRKAVEQTLNTAFGVGDYDIGSLPAQTDDYYMQTHIARFFAHGKWLMFNVKEVLSNIIEDGNYLATNSLVIAVLKKQGYFIHVDTDKASPEACEGEPSMTWDGAQCFALVEKMTSLCLPTNPDGCSEGLLYISQERWDALIDVKGKYRLNPYDFYRTAYSCKRSFPDGERDVDVKALPQDGTIPGCFYNIDVRKGPFTSKNGISDWPL